MRQCGEDRVIFVHVVILHTRTAALTFLGAAFHCAQDGMGQYRGQESTMVWQIVQCPRRYWRLGADSSWSWNVNLHSFVPDYQSHV